MNNKISLLLGKPIKIKDIGKLFQPTIDEIYDYGMDEFNELLSPYSVNIDLYDIPEEQKQEVKNLDLLFHGGKEVVEVLRESLEFYFKESVEVREDLMAFKIGELGVVWRDNFDELAEVVLEINNLEKPQKEIIPKFENERQKDVWYKLREGRRRNSERDQLTLQTIINSLVHGAKSFIPYSEIGKMTMWQLVNTYKSILEVEQYDRVFNQYISGNFDMKSLDLKHWTEKIKM